MWEPVEKSPEKVGNMSENVGKGFKKMKNIAGELRGCREKVSKK